jgi:hypothetical protein
MIFMALQLLPLTMPANSFDPRFVIKVDELCSDGDLALSIPLLRVPLDDQVAFPLRVEHFLEIGDYGYVRSNLVLRPLFTSLAPHDREAFLWRKPNGERVILHKSTDELSKNPKNQQPDFSLSMLPDEIQAFINSQNTCRFYASGATTAWLAEDSLSWGIVLSEKIIFGYENGVLAWFILPSGTKVRVKSDAAMIHELRIDDAVLFNFKKISKTESKISTGRQRFSIYYDGQGRITEIIRLPKAKLVQFEYNHENLLSVSIYRSIKRSYTWAKTQQPLPPVINWVKPYYVKSVNGRQLEYKVTNQSVIMNVPAVDGTMKTTVLRVRYGSIISIQEKKK